MKTGKNIILILLFSITLIACGGGGYHGHFDESPNISESKSHNYYRATYIPDKFVFYFPDKSIVKIDTAWAETMWGYDNNAQTSTNEQLGYNFQIPLKQFKLTKYDLSLADTTNQRFGGSMGKGGFCLNPKILKDTIDILLKDVNPNPDSSTSGWQATIFDTIKFIKQKK